MEMTMKAFDLIKTEKLLHGNHRATLGTWSGAGRTKNDAIADLLTQIASEPEDVRPFVRIAPSSDGGAIWTLYRQHRSWWYDTPSGASCGMGGTRANAIAAMNRHADQYYGITREET